MLQENVVERFTEQFAGRSPDGQEAAANEPEVKNEEFKPRKGYLPQRDNAEG